ncbi:MAG: DUF4926 domain-containing protein [Leptolyngbyaceae cyanobacterium SM1_4_3]|nr:DUF4926 domain-containing protein [Leptolyngbyaceae cyanobacterium SM1_4_3]
MIQHLNAAIDELDVVALTRGIEEYDLKQGDRGAVVHCYRDGRAFEVEFIYPNGETVAVLTLTSADIQKSEATHHQAVLGATSMSDRPKVQMNFNAPVTGAAGNVEGNFVVNAANSEFAEAIATFQKFLLDLQQKYPTATETEAPLLMKAELESIEQHQPERWALLRRDLLNRERWFQGGKAAVTEVTRHFTENNVFAKGAIAFLEAFSETVEKREG